MSINILPVTLREFTFTLIFAQPSPGVDHLAPEVYPALPDDVVPGAGQLVQVPDQGGSHPDRQLEGSPGTVAEDGVENVLVGQEEIIFVLTKDPPVTQTVTQLQNYFNFIFQVILALLRRWIY